MQNAELPKIAFTDPPRYPSWRTPTPQEAYLCVRSGGATVEEIGTCARDLKLGTVRETWRTYARDLKLGTTRETRHTQCWVESF